MRWLKQTLTIGLLGVFFSSTLVPNAFAESSTKTFKSAGGRFLALVSCAVFAEIADEKKLAEKLGLKGIALGKDYTQALYSKKISPKFFFHNNPVLYLNVLGVRRAGRGADFMLGLMYERTAQYALRKVGDKCPKSGKSLCDQKLRKMIATNMIRENNCKYLVK